LRQVAAPSAYRSSQPADWPFLDRRGFRSEQKEHDRRVHLRLKAQASGAVFSAHTQPGFERVAQEEIVARLGAPEILAIRRFEGRAGIVVFRTESPAETAKLRTIEDLFAVLAFEKVHRGFKALDDVRRIAQAAKGVQEALLLRSRIFGGASPKRRLDFRVITRMAGAHSFKRRVFSEAVERGIVARNDYRWRPSEDDNALEFWATLLGDEFLLALRLSDATMRHRSYLVSHRPATLRPSVAAALAWLSKPQPDDIFLDPLCGAGTILIERAFLGRYRLLLGGDKAFDAVVAAKTNFGPRHKPRALALWDATSLPLRDESVDKIVTNLPWGKKLGEPSELPRLYPCLMAEFARVIRPTGLLAILANPNYMTEQLVKKHGLRVLAKLGVEILGTRASVFVLSKRMSQPS